MSLLQLSSKVTLLPVIHGSGDFAIEVRRVMLSRSFDALAVPLPHSFKQQVESAIEHLPEVSVVLSRETPSWKPSTEWSPDQAEQGQEAASSVKYCSYVPIEPCQPIIAALRIALQERKPRFYLDQETADFKSFASVYPDPYAVKQLHTESFSAAILPLLPDLPEGQPRERVQTMVARLRRLEEKFESILFVCSLLEWPYIREVYRQQTDVEHEDEYVEEPERFPLSPKSAYFMLGEMPFVTGLYEQRRAELDDDENLSVDGVKEMLLTARDGYKERWKKHARKITPKHLKTYLQYVRNLSLVERRLTPDLYTLVVGAQQMFGDQFALQLLETAAQYQYSRPEEQGQADMGELALRLPDEKTYFVKSRLPGPHREWRPCELRPEASEKNKEKWQQDMRWNPYSQCSWPPEDDQIERFRARVVDAALSLLNEDLAQTEKFTSSLKDGLDLRETIRHWHTGELFVKSYPPNRGALDSVVMLFDSPADPRDYPWRTTWHAEHNEESTLCFYASSFENDLVGPGIGRARYGGAWFLYPPVPISDIWQDTQFDFTETLEERLLAAACHYSNEKHVVLLSNGAPGANYRRLAKHYGKKWLHIPLTKFSQSMVEAMRTVHVLNGKEVRSYASEFIRKA
ncbi:hypothetical protein Pla110_09260 [Polystyrenella longa]|uniref:Uncharacterized protein n=1 Tax=Polystyrenella longa TaxID=2528007 RepID=A0A518CJ25_9PLAN|nr:hypothetical protein [Polystyrenella longa]QDU79221.1 hypothetical protein Pla110_09260 [Polystyrenella longa]